jgi:phosphoribosylamine--glycine ligase
MKRVMLVGGGAGRDHALATALAQSPEVSKVLFVPGNSAAEYRANKAGLPISSAAVASQDIPGLIELAEMEEIDLTVFGPNTPLVMGAVDQFTNAGLCVAGPTRAAARLEGSKVFAKNFMLRNGIPSARFAVFTDTSRAAAFCRSRSWARVIKTDGLAYERGVAVTTSLEDALEAVQRVMVDEVLDPNGDARVVIEERLEGPEITLCILSDGKDVKVLDANLNYPRLGDGNSGPRTRGMGAVSPAPFLSKQLRAQLIERIAEPLVEGIAAQGKPLVGAIFVDIIVQRGEPYVLDINVRFGDPATQVLLKRLKTDLFSLLAACVDGTLGQIHVNMDPRPAVSVIVAAEGYPFRRSRGAIVKIPDVVENSDRRIDMGGIRWRNEQYETTGGRVATITAIGSSTDEARVRAYEGVHSLAFKGIAFRSDIGT